MGRLGHASSGGPRDPSVASILVRSEDGTTRFLVKLAPSDSLEVLHEYVALERCGSGKFKLIRPFPRMVLHRDPAITIEQAGLCPNAVLCMTRIPDDEDDQGDRQGARRDEV